MSDGMLRLAAVALAVFLVNLPFGYRRAGARKFSLAWILAVHLPVPVVVALRFASGLGWQPVSFPVLVAAYAAGQFVGGRLRRHRAG